MTDSDDRRADSPPAPAPDAPEAPQPVTDRPHLPQSSVPQSSVPLPYVSEVVAPVTVPPAAPSLVAGLRWAWARLAANAGAIAGAALAWIGILVGAYIASFTVLLLPYIIAIGAAYGHPAAQFVIVMVFLVIVLLSAAVPVSCWLNGLLRIADGHRVRVGDFLTTRALKPVLAIHLVVGLVSAIAQVLFTYGLGLLWLAGLVSVVVGALVMWTTYAAADLRTDVRTAASTGLALTAAHLGPSVAVYLTAVVLTIAGLLLIVVGALVTAPLSGLLMLYYFRSLSRRPIVAGDHPATAVP